MKKAEGILLRKAIEELSPGGTRTTLDSAIGTYRRLAEEDERTRILEGIKKPGEREGLDPLN